MSAVTPMMQQYLDLKEQYRDCILFFRLGDFYEMFFEDARTASRELEITLTGRDCGLEERAPMCGVPYHSADTYISRLIKKGFKVAICEQVEDPALARGLVRRDVVRVITPGTIIDSSMLDEKKNNYLVCVYKRSYYFGIAAVDITTGDFAASHIVWGNTVSKLIDETAKFSPSEIVANNEFYADTALTAAITGRFGTYISVLEDACFTDDFAHAKIKEHFSESELLKKEHDLSLNAAGALLEYLVRTQKVNLQHIASVNTYRVEEYMILDAATRRNLEITETITDKSRKGTLLWVIDRTMTSMGGRMIRKWLEQPLINTGDIRERLDSVREFKERFMLRSEIRELLKRVYDIERLMGKVILGNVNCRDLVALKNSAAQIPYIRRLLENCTAEMNVRCLTQTDNLSDIFELIEKAIVEDPPISVKEGGIIKKGYNEEVDRLRSAATDGRKWIAEIESREREKTGIKNLKVGFNKVFGYYLEVTRSYFHLIPESYIRKQTLANCERYITQELKELEELILGAEEKVIELEFNLFSGVKDELSREVSRIKNTARCLAEIDTLCALAETADRESYCMPEVTNDDVIEITDGRHPVVEKMLESGTFVPNSTKLDLQEDVLAVITGPNMAGKSTYIRQVALIVLMAQMGSFVPAAAAQIGITDRIFTRIGASDDLAGGRSTFMVEMTEVANILNNATKHSLLVLDEVGRGTSTYDGLSIAWAIIEYVTDRDNGPARTLFATHYHELTELEGRVKGVKNYCIAVKEKGDEIIFLRKIIRGGADDSYGIQVARLAGVPEAVLGRAREILAALEEADISKKELRKRRNRLPIEGQIDLFTYSAVSKTFEEILEDIRKVDIHSITPLDAMNILYKLKQKASKGRSGEGGAGNE